MQGTNRREARRIALLAMYARECTGYSVSETLDHISSLKKEWAKLPGFTRALCELFEQNADEVSSELEALLENWKMERVGVVERAILKLGYVEIAFFPDIPPRVTINEYLELAKLYAGDQTPAFINGVLDKVIHQKGKPDVQIERIRHHKK
jgi:N utilization substance protein B